MATKKKVAKKKAGAGDAEIEKKALAALKKAPKSNQELHEALKIEKSVALGRTLQRLRRQGKIQALPKKHGGRWAVAGFKLCPKCGGRGFVED